MSALHRMLGGSNVSTTHQCNDLLKRLQRYHCNLLIFVQGSTVNVHSIMDASILSCTAHSKSCHHGCSIQCQLHSAGHAAALMSIKVGSPARTRRHDIRMHIRTASARAPAARALKVTWPVPL